MVSIQKSVKFDPGFAQHTTILSLSLEYIYKNINTVKNFGQKKLKFKMNYPNIVKMVENNVGFCMGCILWGIYIKSLGSLEIDGNPCLGDKYNKEKSVEEIDFSIEYFEQLKKDVKYYLGQDYEIKPLYIDVLELYREFLTINENFVATRTTDDIKLPQNIKTPDESELAQIHERINEVIKSGKLEDLTEFYSSIIK